jgi:flagellar hook-associated protein 2
MPININGVVSGLDTEKIVKGLLDIQQQQLDRMALRKSEIQTRQTAFRNVESKLLSLRADVGVLSRNTNNPLTRLAVTASDTSAIAARASSSAVAGVYRLTVNSTAQAHQVATQGLADADSQITQGTFEIRLGSGDLKSITIDSNNNTLSGLAAAINSSGAGVSANVIQDSSGGAAPWRLVLTSTRTGASNVISVSNNLADSAGSAVKPEFDFLNPVQAAEDARVTLGSGAGAISVTSSTNQFKNVIAGVDFDLLQATSGQVLSLTVAKDNSAAIDAVQSFVESFNGVVQYIDDNSKYNAATSEGGVLLGNQSAARIQQSLRSTIQNVVPGANPLANRLSAIGLTFSDTGKLVLNKSRLESALSGGIEGVSAEDVRKIFALSGNSTNSGISFVLGSTRTKASTSGYEVDITQAAERAVITAGSSPASSTTITSANHTLEIRVDGKSATITLKDGTYTGQELADHLESVINQSTILAGRQVKVGLSGGALQVTSASYGTSSEVTIAGGNAVSVLGFTSGQTNTGRDVVGSFRVDGQTEVAVGRGRLLTGDPQNNNTADLQVQVTLSSTQVVSGAEGRVTVSRGLASSLDQLLGQLLNTDQGLLNSVDDGFDGQLKSLQSSIDRQKAAFDRQQARLLTQFQSLESAISQMQSTSNYLGGQLASLPKIGN